MAKGTRICRVCGEPYPYCKTHAPGVFRWQDVACCPEHAAIYFDEVERARAADVAQQADGSTVEEVVASAEVAAEQKPKVKRTSKKKAATE